jgi:hypothetical protein
MPVTEAAIFNRPIIVTKGVPAKNHASSIAPVYVCEELGDPSGWAFLLDQVEPEARSTTAREELANVLWREHVSQVDSLYSLLGTSS